MLTTNNHPRAMLGVEALEARDTPAGNVTVQLAGGQLFVIGDAADNAVSTQQDVFGNIVIFGVNGTTVNGQSSVFVGQGVLRDAIFQGGGGNDQIDVAGLLVIGGVSVVTGDGVDLITIRDVTADYVSAYSLGGNDSLITTNVVARVGADFAGGNGFDIWDFNGVSAGFYLTHREWERIV